MSSPLSNQPASFGGAYVSAKGERKRSALIAPGELIEN